MVVVLTAGGMSLRKKPLEICPCLFPSTLQLRGEATT